MLVSTQSNTMPGIIPPVPPQPPAVQSHQTTTAPTVTHAVSPPPVEFANSTKEERTKSASSGVVQSPKDSPPSARSKNAGGGLPDNPGVEHRHSNNVNTG